MTQWPTDELRRIVGTGDLHVTPFREDGTTCGCGAKYGGSPYLAPMIGTRARATVRITPRQRDLT